MLLPSDRDKFLWFTGFVARIMSELYRVNPVNPVNILYLVNYYSFFILCVFGASLLQKTFEPAALVTTYAKTLPSLLLTHLKNYRDRKPIGADSSPDWLLRSRRAGRSGPVPGRAGLSRRNRDRLPRRLYERFEPLLITGIWPVSASIEAFFIHWNHLIPEIRQ